jgi:ferredoxin
MIVANRKPFQEIMSMLEPYSRVLLLACNACVTVCAAGGTKEAAVLASEIRLFTMNQDRPADVREMTLERNCDPEYVGSLKGTIEAYEAVLSMACGCGVQAVAETYPHKPVLPAVNTTFEGVTVEQGVWAERCQGCGNCMLHRTSGVCPVARCAKSLLNGPCGGSRNGKCEVDIDTPCIWQIIVDRLKESGLLESYLRIEDPKDWSTGRDGGPRKRIREDLKL